MVGRLACGWVAVGLGLVAGCRTDSTVIEAPEAARAVLAKGELGSGGLTRRESRRPLREMPGPSAEQEAELEKFCEACELGLGAGVRVYNDPIGDSFRRAERVVGRRFDWRLSVEVRDVAKSFPGGVIVVNPNVLGMYSDAAPVYFWYFHEAAHHVLDHFRRSMVFGPAGPRWNHHRELEADAFAGSMLRRMELSERQTRTTASRALATAPVSGTPTHPGRNQRVAAVMQGWRRGG